MAGWRTVGTGQDRLAYGWDSVGKAGVKSGLARLAKGAVRRGWRRQWKGLAGELISLGRLAHRWVRVGWRVKELGWAGAGSGKGLLAKGV